MNIDSLFSQPFHKNQGKTVQEILKWKLKKIVRFPYTDFIVKGDEFFKRVWQMIDRSQEYFWMTTYAMDSSPIADTTLLKLIEASKRGVHVVLFIDNVQFWAKQELIQRFQNCGGRFLLLNPQFTKKSVSGYLSKDIWRRHHQKLIVSDSWGIIGSANIEASYGGLRYGSSQYQDLNYITQNIVLDQYRQHFADTADMHEFNLSTSHQNESLIKKLDKNHPNSQFYQQGKYQLLHNDHLSKLYEIEDGIIKMVESATKEIKIMQPYHYPMIKFDRVMKKAVERGIVPTILTTGQRDQPVFKSLFNFMLFQRLILKGIDVFETKQRMLHSKVYMTDKENINLGSMNNDRWSWKINNQVNLAIKDKRDYEWIDNYFSKMMSRSRPVPTNFTISASRAASISFWQNFLYLSQILMSRRGRPEEAFVNDSAQIPQKNPSLQ